MQFVMHSAIQRSAFIVHRYTGGLVGRGAGLGHVLVQLQHPLDQSGRLVVLGFVGFIIRGCPFLSVGDSRLVARLGRQVTGDGSHAVDVFRQRDQRFR
jgi:hypothetical protein